MSADLRAGIYEHYKHHLYRVLGTASWDTAESFDWNRMRLVGVAHYSEDPDWLALVAEPLYETDRNQMVYFWLNSIPEAAENNDPMVVYTALHASPLDEPFTPRLSLRPFEDHPEAWTTPKYISNLNSEVERFRFVEDPSQLPALTARHDFRRDLGHKICQRCGVTVSLP